MTKDQFNSLFKSGDAGSLWAAIENAEAQRDSSMAAADAMTAERDAAREAATKAKVDADAAVAAVAVARQDAAATQAQLETERAQAKVDAEAAVKTEQDKGAAAVVLLKAQSEAAAKDLTDKLQLIQSEFASYKQATEELVALSQTDPQAAADAARAKLAQTAADRQREALLAQQAAIEAQLAAL